MVKLGVCLQAVSLPSLPAVLVFKDGTYYTYNGETDTGCDFLLCTKMADKTDKTTPHDVQFGLNQSLALTTEGGAP